MIECYWIVENDDVAVRQEKIIPDGYPEIILHYADHYKINLNGTWSLQTPDLLGGQISRYFYLENTGRSGMIGIKLFPTALRHLFGISMHTLTDSVVDLNSVLGHSLDGIGNAVRDAINHTEQIEVLNVVFSDAASKRAEVDHLIDRIVESILQKQGLITISELTETFGVGERRLERLFREYVGLSPKFYSRIIRFNAIFSLKQQGLDSWMDLVYETGFYDQSHFIKNFKEFTGEEPSEYLFENQNMANFFLKRLR